MPPTWLLRAVMPATLAALALTAALCRWCEVMG